MSFSENWECYYCLPQLPLLPLSAAPFCIRFGSLAQLGTSCHHPPPPTMQIALFLNSVSGPL